MGQYAQSPIIHVYITNMNTCVCVAYTPASWLHVLIQVDGESHVLLAEEEAMGTRLIINTLTCLLSKDVDPSRLIASSPGKLVR